MAETPDTSPPANAPAEQRSTAVETRPAPAKPRHKPLPPWKVLLHNDDVNDMFDVVATIRMLTPLTKEEAVQRMLEAHYTGVALLLVTHQERAELYVQQFASRGLTVTAEAE